MHEIAPLAEQPKAPETTPKWHQPTLTILDAEAAETGPTGGTVDASIYS
jgi:hypothetical protein